MTGISLNIRPRASANPASAPQLSLVSVSDSIIIDHTLHPNSHPSSMCVLSTHLLRACKIGGAACRNVSQVSVSNRTVTIDLL